MEDKRALYFRRGKTFHKSHGVLTLLFFFTVLIGWLACTQTAAAAFASVKKKWDSWKVAANILRFRVQDFSSWYLVCTT